MPFLWLVYETVLSKVFQGISQLPGLLPLQKKMKLTDRSLSLPLINFSYKFSSGKWLDIKKENKNWEFLPV